MGLLRKMETTGEKYALVTGAGKGLGLAFARELASRKIPVILVSMPGEGLDESCKKIKNEFGVDARYFEGDLTQPSEIEKMGHWVAENFKLFVLVNNVGLGHSGEFATTNIKILDTMVLLNVRATTLVTHQLLPVLKQNTPAYILNISSMASFSPFGFKAVYAASKVYIEYLSKGLHRELKSQGIIVSTAHPGPMNTNPDVAARIKNQNIIGRMGVKDPEEVAKGAISLLFSRHRFILVGFANYFQWLMMKIIPHRLLISMLTFGVKREMKGKGTKTPAA